MNNIDSEHAGERPASSSHPTGDTAISVPPHGRPALGALDPAVFRSIVETSDDAISLCDESGCMVYANLAYRRLFGIPDRNMAPGNNRSETHSAPSANTLDTAWVSLLRHNAFPVTTQGGQTLQGYILHDATELKCAEEAFQQLVDHSIQGFVIIQRDGIVYANKACTDITGYTIDELMAFDLDTLVATLLPAVDHAFAREVFADGFGGRLFQTRSEVRIFTKDRSEKWIDTVVDICNFKGKLSIQAAIVDITDRMTVIRELQKSEEQYRILVENITDLIYTVDREGFLTYVNPAVESVLGYRPVEVVGRNILDFIYPGDHKIVFGVLDDMIGGIADPLEIRVVARSGTVIWGLTNIRPLLINCEFAGLQGVFKNISDRKHAEELARYKELFNNVADGVFIIDDDWRFVEANDRVFRWSGLTRSELLSCSILDMIDPLQQERLQEMKDDIRLNGLQDIELRIAFDHGDLVPYELSCQRITYLEKPSCLCVCRDITEKKALQDQLIISERLAAIGQLAASVAHEINSPLQAITVMLSMMRKNPDDRSELPTNITLLEEAFDTIKSTVHTLLDLNRPGNENMQATNINTVIEKTVTLVRSHLRVRRIQPVLRLSRTIPKISASPQQLSQVFLNIINNAVESMTSGTSNGHASRRHGGEIRFISTAQDGAIIIEIADTGPGIPPTELQRIFDPFYSLKKKMGTGMGLAICHNIIRSHGGTLTARNGKDGGAIFSITLPINGTSPDLAPTAH